MVQTGKRDEFSSRLLQALRYAGKDGYGMGARLAKTMHVTPKAVSKWLNGEARPSHDRRVALARWLGVREEWLDYGRGAMLHIDEDTSYSSGTSTAANISERLPSRSYLTSKKSANALQHIEQAALSGELDETDLLLLVQIAKHIAKKKA